MTIFKTGKYQGKTMDWVAENDIDYLISIYWLICSHPIVDHKRLTDIEISINKVGKDIFYKKDPEFKIYKELKFGKYNGLTFEEIIIQKKDAKYLWYLLGEISRSKTPDINLKHSIEYYFKKSGCITFERQEGVSGFQYCKTCHTMHKL